MTQSTCQTTLFCWMMIQGKISSLFSCETTWGMPFHDTFRGRITKYKYLNWTKQFQWQHTILIGWHIAIPDWYEPLRLGATTIAPTEFRVPFPVATAQRLRISLLLFFFQAKEKECRTIWVQCFWMLERVAFSLCLFCFFFLLFLVFLMLENLSFSFSIYREMCGELFEVWFWKECWFFITPIFLERCEELDMLKLDF